MQKPVLILSVFLNLLLVIVLMNSSSKESRPIPRTPRIQPVGPAEPGPTRLAPPASDAQQEPSAWSWVEAGTLGEMMTRLRAVGCPEQTIQDIVISRVCRNYRNRLKEHATVAARARDFTKHFGRAEAREQSDVRLGLEEEMRTELEQLLGQSWGVLRAQMVGWYSSKPVTTLSLAQEKAVRDIGRRYAKEADEFSHRSLMGQLDESDRIRLRQIEAEKWAALAAVLPPKELEDYWFRTSAAADYVRKNLPEAKNEEEFRKTVKVADEFHMMEEGSLGKVYGIITVDESDARSVKERQAAFEKRLREILGDDRVAQQEEEEKARLEEERRLREAKELERARQQLQAQAAAVGVAAEDANRFFDRLRELEPVMQKKFEELEKNLGGTPEEKAAQMKTAVRAEFESAARQILGDKAPVLVQKILEKEP